MPTGTKQLEAGPTCFTARPSSCRNSQTQGHSICTGPAGGPADAARALSEGFRAQARQLSGVGSVGLAASGSAFGRPRLLRACGLSRCECLNAQLTEAPL